MVPADSIQVPRDWIYSGTLRESNNFRLRVCHPLWMAFPSHSTNCLIGNSHVKSPTTPNGKSTWFGLFPVRSPLLRKSIFLSTPTDTEMFQFSAFAIRTYGFSTYQFGYPRIRARLTATLGLSQSSTPFNAS
jgi:hypothetical protein